MTAFVDVVLDTTAPALEVETTQDFGQPTLFTLALTTDEPTEVRIWGAIDPTDPANASYAETENAAPWLPWSDSLQVVATPGGGPIFIRGRDEVWNQTSRILVTGVVPEPEQPAPTVPQGGRVTPGRRHAPTTRVIRSRSTVRLHSATRVTRDVTRHESRVRLPSRERIIRLNRAVRSRSTVRLESRTRVRSSLSVAETFAVPVTDMIHRRREGPDTEAALLELDIL